VKQGQRRNNTKGIIKFFKRSTPWSRTDELIEFFIGNVEVGEVDREIDRRVEDIIVVLGYPFIRPPFLN
jgi:hypothetical protein